MKFKQTLIRYRALIMKTMIGCLVFGLLMAALDVLVSKDIDWQQADLVKVSGAQLSMDESQQRLLLRGDKGREAAFFCNAEHYALCPVVMAHQAGHGGQAMAADVEYLAVEGYDAVMLGADYVDDATKEQVSLRYPKAVVDRQADEVEQAGSRWNRILVALRHFSLTLFVVMLLAWLYAGLGQAGKPKEEADTEDSD